MRSRSLPIGLLLVLLSPLLAVGEKPTAPSRDQIARWIEELGAGEFVAREDATQQLIAAGPKVIDPLAKNLEEADLETAARGIYVLRELALSDDREAEEAARAALTTLAGGRLRSGGALANSTLAHLDEIRQERTLASLQELGAEVQYSEQVQIGLRFEFDVTAIEIGGKFQGEPEDLAQLKWLADVEVIKLEGDVVTNDVLAAVGQMKNLKWVAIKRAKVDDAGLAHLVGLKNLTNLDVFYTPIGDDSVKYLRTFQGAEWLKLYGTKISKQSAENLQAAMIGVRVDHRNGGFLGVGGQTHPLGCSISVIHPGSAAQQADIRSGDVITRYEGQKVEDFEALTELIGQNVAGDTIKLEIWRRGETLQKEVKLGEWE